MQVRRSAALILGVLFLLAAIPGARLTSALAAATTKVIFKVVKDYGKVVDLKRSLTPPDTIDESDDGVHGYKVRAVEVNDESQLLRLMGAVDESGLTDTQKGLLEVFRMAKTGRVNDLTAYAPAGDRKLIINLIDISGTDDRNRFPAVKNDFWPRASKSMTFLGDKVNTEINVVISGVDSQGFGAQTAKEMKVTFAHEFGHTIDLTRTEDQPYGPDGHHWHNEIIGERAAFAEGFANFVSIMAFPERAREFRQGIFQVQYEDSTGYKRYPPDDPAVKPTDLLRVEAVVALLLNRLAKDIPDGREKVLQAFKKSNSWQNSLSKFLKTFIDQNPADAYTVAQIFDEESRKRLSNEEIRQFLGDSREVESYLATRPRPATPGKTVQTPPASTQPTSTAVTPTQNPPSDGRSRIYKWKDASGRIHFTDVPPPANVTYTIMSPMKLPVQVRGDSPFSDE